MTDNGDGYYRKNGIQNTGTAIKKGKSDICIYMPPYNKDQKKTQVYPRELEKTISGNKFGSFTLITYRDNNYGTRSGVAYQGAKSNSTTFPTKNSQIHESWGQIKPSSIPTIDGLIAVTEVSAKFKPHSCGLHGYSRDLIFNVGNTNNTSQKPSLISGTTYTYTLAKNSDSLSSIDISGSGENNDLCKLIYKLLTSGNELVLYNGEDVDDMSNPKYSDGTGYGSRNYAAIDSFTINSIKVKYQP